MLATLVSTAKADACRQIMRALAAGLRLGFCSAIVYTAALAQTPTSAAPPPVLVTDSFQGVVTDSSKPATTITAYRMGDLSAGDSFSGVVTSDATDQSQLSGLVYQVVAKDPSGKQTVVSQAPVLQGVYKGLIPAAAVVGGGVLIGELLKDGKQVGTATPVPMETQPAETTHPPLTSDSYKIPSLMQAGKPTAIAFNGGDGDLTTTQVTVGGQPVQELAEGPNGTVFRSPTNITGPTTVTISKNGVTGSGQSRNVAISLSAVSKSLQTGTQEVLTGTVSGLEGLNRPLNVTLKNNTPAVTLQGGNLQTVTISPESVQTDGTSTFERDIAAEHAGPFDIGATLEGLSIPMGNAPAGLMLASLADWGCWDQCKVPEVSACTVDHIHVSIGAGGVNDFDLEDTNSALDFMAVVEGIASVIEPSPASGASGATLGVTEVAKGLVEQLEKRKDMIKQGGSATITLVLQRSYCSRVACYMWPLHQNIWKKETFDQEVEPPAGLGSGDPGKWVGANFNLSNADVRQALKDAYEKALKKCEGQ